MTPKIEAPDWTEEPAARHPVIDATYDAYAHRVLGDPGGLTQFGALLERLPPGASSGLRHWHEAEDEFVLLLEGEVVLVEDAETTLRPGDAAAWPANGGVGHRLENRGEGPAVYLVVGTRARRDVVHYPDHDLVLTKDGASRDYARADGTPLRGDAR